MTFNNPTDIYFIKPGKSRFTPAIGYFFINLLLGWWGIPWGPIYTIGNFITMIGGGTDVTQEVMGQLNQNDPSYATGNTYNIGGNTSSQPSNASSSYNIPGNSNQSSGSGSGSSTYNIPR
jgi:hypothetical protein